MHEDSVVVVVVRNSALLAVCPSVHVYINLRTEGLSKLIFGRLVPRDMYKRSCQLSEPLNSRHNIHYD